MRVTHRSASIGRGIAAVLASAWLVAACGGTTGPTAPPTFPSGTTTGSSAGGTATVHFVYRAPTAPRAGLPQECVQLVGRTHIHPSWRAFARFDMSASGSDRWEIAFSDVPVNTRLAVRVSDANACDENATGAATRNVFANNVRLVEIVPTPGSGTEPGLAFTVGADGTVTP